MLKLVLKQVNPNQWMAKVTISGRGISPEAGEWETGRTSEEAKKKVLTKLKKEWIINQNAAYRIGVCAKMIYDSLEKLPDGK